MSQLESALPETRPMTVDTNKTALLVLDLTETCADPNHQSHSLVSGISEFLDKARAAGMPIVFTVSIHLKGTPAGKVYSGFHRRASEPVLFPDGFDKFTGGELQSLLRLYEGVDTIIIVGCSSNICVLHTATTAARELNYNIVIPIDGVAALTDYKEQYALFHLANLPGPAAGRVAFSKLDMINF